MSISRISLRRTACDVTRRSVAAGIASIALASLPAQAAYVADPMPDAASTAIAALKDRLATSGDADSFVGASAELAAPDADALRPTVATPAPEPETAALMVAGIGAVAWAARRRRRPS